MENPRTVLAYFQALFDWITEQISQGHNVLIHCLAGAHRAGTTGVAWCMYANKEPFLETLHKVKNIRSIVDPFGPLGDLLMRLEKAVLATRNSAPSFNNVMHRFR